MLTVWFCALSLVLCFVQLDSSREHGHDRSLFDLLRAGRVDLWILHVQRYRVRTQHTDNDTEAGSDRTGRAQGSLLPATLTSVRAVCVLSFHKAVADQPQGAWFPSETLKMAVCGVLFGVGQLFVLSSFFRLGVTGTFLGDYCGIFMSERVTGFPFNVVDNPMYVGSTMSFLAYSLWYSSSAGLLIAATVAVVYYVALKFEGSTHSTHTQRQANTPTCTRVGLIACSLDVPLAALCAVVSPYTTQIYLERDAARSAKGKKAQ